MPLATLVREHLCLPMTTTHAAKRGTPFNRDDRASVRQITHHKNLTRQTVGHWKRSFKKVLNQRRCTTARQHFHLHTTGQVGSPIIANAVNRDLPYSVSTSSVRKIHERFEDSRKSVKSDAPPCGFSCQSHKAKLQVAQDKSGHHVFGSGKVATRAVHTLEQLLAQLSRWSNPRPWQ